MEKFLFLSVIALCGTLTSSFNVGGASRIVNGTAATNLQYRYAISLQKVSEAAAYTRGHRCGGGLITRQHALTAASCNFDLVNGVYRVINPLEYRVFTGAANLTQDNTTYNAMPVSRITVHPHYRPHIPYVHDIAVIFLASTISSSPISLPPRDIHFLELTPCNVAGWGAQNNTALASVQMMQFNKYVTEDGDCQRAFVGQITILDTMVCATTQRWETEYAGCTGDIGNPLVCGGNLHGILIKSKNCTVSVQPEVYTRIFKYKDWINEVIGNRPLVPSGASTYQPGLAVLALIASAHIIITNVSSQGFFL